MITVIATAAMAWYLRTKTLVNVNCNAPTSRAVTGDAAANHHEEYFEAIASAV